MFYIKLGNDKSVVVTVREPIIQGENLSQKIRFLIPVVVDDIDVLSASIYLNYIRADGTPDIVILERIDEKYNDGYYQYTFPVDCKLTRYAGDVCIWLHIFSGSPSNPSNTKSDECAIQIQASKNMDDYLCDHQITAIYQLQKSIENSSDGSIDFDKNEENGGSNEDGSSENSPDNDDVIYF